MRPLGIPTAIDRLIQQMILQVLTPLFDPTFSIWSFGFRPGRSAHDAIVSAQGMVQSGRRVVVDVDLKSFFDRVQHDVLMVRLSRRIADRELLVLIRRFLSAGILAGGITLERHEGTPQGGPLSPLLANILLDDVDKALERHGHSFVRYADDCNVYVRSRRAVERVMSLLRRLYGRLRLEINEEKSAVGRAHERKFLGYSFWYATGSVVKRRVASKTLQVFKAEIRKQTRRVRGVSLASVIGGLKAKLVGWRNYFRLADTPGIFRKLDEWIRHRLRAFQLKQWRRGRTAFRALRGLGASVAESAQIAGNLRRWWHNSGLLMNKVLDIRFFDRLGLPKLVG
jgi:group II intron reverse transcriptase/maturase